MSRTGILLINLGTPDQPDAKSVYRYLKQFLNDPRVIDLPYLARKILVNVIIVPFRHKKSAHAYQQVWTAEGSPLLVHSNALTTAVANALGDDYHVVLGMRYGNPSIASAIEQLSACEKIIVLPLFPQYSSAATGSALEETLRVIQSSWNIPTLSIKNNFYNNAEFIAAFADTIQTHLNNKTWDTLLFSYHGLPERHLDKSHCQAACSRKEACPIMNESNAYCYRAQCYETSRLLAQALGLSPAQYKVTFQSRLGKTPWIKPYTDLVLNELIAEQKKNIAIVCPSFVADCLETLEEINMRAREQWQSLGGEEFTFIPCINANPLWVNGVVKLVREM